MILAFQLILFFFFEDSTPINSLHGGRGLTKSIVDTSVDASTTKLLKDLPFTVNDKGETKIEYALIKSYLDWDEKAQKKIKELIV